MRMRFWATIRKPAFSISALTAPVRLRSVASGLMIEKVRSIAIVYVLAKHAGWRVAGLISASPHDGKRPGDPPCRSISRYFRAANHPRPLRGATNYNNFTKVNPFCIRRHAAIQLRRRRLNDDRTPAAHPRGPGRYGRRSHRWRAFPRRNLEETIMLRKLSLVAVAAASLGSAALAPTSAQAWGGGWHHGG